ncbi:hypothetical protein [Rhizobium leguminosarum]|uniref:hypothetical protein n=1 Tax=Rhizobium leguminosarum TaxID=384 RepID=UPI0015D9ADBB|nr:hypothetical protein [Rhizobium leguminosarum]NZD54181.1 hypothetical protein [Rhizobium leguminosarum]
MQKEQFDGNTLRKISNLYKAQKAGKKPIVEHDWRDVETTGLAIRVKPTGASWRILTREINAIIGDFHLFDENDLPQLRALVAEARLGKKQGHQPDALIKAFLETRDVKVARDIHKVVKEGAKVWEDARDAFLEWAYRNKATKTVDGYKSALGACKDSVYEPDFRHIAGKALASITLGDLGDIRDSIVDRGEAGELKGTGHRQADLTVAALRSCFRYITAKRRIYKLEENVALGLTNVIENEDANVESDGGDKLRPMSQLEIGAFIYALESCDNEIARLALFLQLLTGQRRFTACSSVASSFVEHDHYGIVWRIKAKGDNWRVLPLPEMAQDIVRKAKEDYKDFGCRYLLPKTRHRTAGDNMQKHIDPREASKQMEDMRKPGGVFHSLDLQPSTHTLRKGFISFMRPRMHEFVVGGRQLQPDDVQWITHSDEGRETTAAQVYDLNDYLDVKHAILKRWEEYCMEGYTLYMQQQQTALAA